MKEDGYNYWLDQSKVMFSFLRRAKDGSLYAWVATKQPVVATFVVQDGSHLGGRTVSCPVHSKHMSREGFGDAWAVAERVGYELLQRSSELTPEQRRRIVRTPALEVFL
jgi:hypothetical protein